MLGWDSSKLLYIRSEIEHYEGAEPSVEITEITNPEQVVQYFLPAILNYAPAMNALLANKEFLKALDQRGIRNINEITNVVDKIKLGTRFFQSNGNYSLREINLNKVEPFDAECLANDEVMLLQSVEKSTLKETSPAAYKRMLDKRKKNEQAAAARIARAEARKNNRKQKDIEAAKKLLAEQGEL